MGTPGYESIRGGQAAAEVAMVWDFARRHALLLIVSVAAAARFAALGAQSFWLDEYFTTQVIGGGFLDMAQEIRGTSNPPLYYGIAWGWERLIGTDEIGLRSFSALLGTATVPVVYAAACALASRRAGLVAAALTATNPMLIWYSQEARNYALLIFLCALSFLFFVQALRKDHPGWLWGWGVSSALALGTHYFALTLIAPEAAWLLLRARGARTHVAGSIGIVAAVGIALVPLAEAQRGPVEWISTFEWSDRLIQIPAHFLVGMSVPWRVVPSLVGVVFGAGVIYALVRAEPPARQAFAVAGGIGLAGLAVAIIPSVVGADYVLSRNLLELWVPLAIAAAAVLSARRVGALGLATAAVLCLVGLALVIWTAATPAAQRGDWRQLAAALGEPERQRLIVAKSQWSWPLVVYIDGAQSVASDQRLVASELAVIDPKPVTDYGIGPCWWRSCGSSVPFEVPEEFKPIGGGSTELLRYRLYRAPRSVSLPGHGKFFSPFFAQTRR